MSKCPCCTQEIQNDICIYCREWVGFPFPFEIKNLLLFWEGFSYKGKNFKYDDITNLYYLNQKMTINFVPSSSADLKICTLSDEKIRIQSKRSLIMPGKKKIEKIEQAYKVLRIRSLNSRLHFYIEQLGLNYIDYKHGYMNFGSIVRIYNNGIIEKGNKKIDLTVANKKKLMLFGTHRESFTGRYQHHNPNEILISETGFGMFDKKISFSAYWDYDIVVFILKELAEGKSFKSGSQVGWVK